MTKEIEEKEKLILKPSGISVGIFIALFYIILMFLIPYCVPEINNKLTSIRFFPYIIFITISAFSIAFAIIFRKQRYELDFGIWPVVLGSFLYYLSIKFLGFYVSTFFIIFYVSFFWKFKNYIIVVISAVATPVIIYLFFTLGMGIHMPGGLLF